MQNRREFIKRSVVLAAMPLMPGGDITGRGNTNLIVRADDMGMSHAANLGCLETYQKGIVRSVEVMVPCAWFPEAVDMLNKNKGLDAGLHLTLNSEWRTIRWRPLTCGKSLVDEDGYFYRGFQNPGDDNTLLNGWDLHEVENELRAQIETGLKKIPHLTHFSDHMFFSREKQIDDLMRDLAGEYDLFYANQDYIGRARGPKPYGETIPERTDWLKRTIADLGPGTWLLITHPSTGTKEAFAVKGSAGEGPGRRRQMSLQYLTSPELVEFCNNAEARLISYKDLITK